MDVKAVVDKQKNRVIIFESNEDFVDVLFSFLTMPMGAVVRVTRDVTPEVGIGCMNNLYNSVENLERNHFWTEQCKDMLLRPQNGAAAHCENLKVKIDDAQSIRYTLCNNFYCTFFSCQFTRTYPSCYCGETMSRMVSLYDPTFPGNGYGYSAARVGNVFVRGLTKLLISDELQVLPLSSAGSFSLLSNSGVMDASAIEVKSFIIRENEVLNLLKWSLVSMTSLTETLLKHELVPQLGSENIDKCSFIKHQREEHVSEEKGKICVKLTLSKSKKMVCYAEASQDFVNLLFSFLTIPLGCVAKKLQGCPSKKCISSLYESAQNLDAEKYLKSNYHKEILVNPKIAPGYGYENQKLGVEEAVYYYSHERKEIYAGVQCSSTGSETSTALTVTDPRFDYKNTDKSCVGFVGPATFLVTDNLIITPQSQISCLEVLSKLKVPFSDIEECVVHIGNGEASQLLVAALVSKTALTDALIYKALNKEY